VVAVARNRDNLEAVVGEIRSAGRRADLVVCDLGESGAAQRLFSAVDEIGRVEGLVCCAATLRRASVGETDPEQWRATMRVNLDAVWDCGREAFVRMQGCTGGGRPVKNLVELAAVEPDSAAAGAVVDLDTLAFGHHQIDVDVGGALHGHIRPLATEHLPDLFPVQCLAAPIRSTGRVTTPRPARTESRASDSGPRSGTRRHSFGFGLPRVPPSGRGCSGRRASLSASLSASNVHP